MNGQVSAALPLHSGHLLALATDADKMAAAQGEIIQAVSRALQATKADIETSAVVVGIAPGDGGARLTTEVIFPTLIDPVTRGLCSTVHFVSANIAPLVEGKAHDDEQAFDAALARTRSVIEQVGVNPALAPLLTETAMAAIHAEAFAQSMSFTLYGDGRLLVLKGSLLARLMQDYQRELRYAAAKAR